MKDVQSGEEDTSTSDAVFIRVSVPELKSQKCLQFQLEDTVWQAKQKILAAYSKDLKDPLNYGLYQPPRNGRAGKFLEEERLLKEYPLEGPIGFLEFKYKRRVYKMLDLNPRKLKQLHSKTSLRHFVAHVRHGNVQKMTKMTSRGLDPNFFDAEDGETPLSLGATVAPAAKTREVLLSLVSGGAHLDFRTRTGLTALHRAACVGSIHAVKTLLDLGASPNLKDARGLTPLYYAVASDASPVCTEMLLHERAFVGTHDQHGWCEIHQACRYGRVQHLEHLLYYGAEINVQNSNGNTLSTCVPPTARYNQEECARVLLFRGADRGILNVHNQTAYQMAVVHNAMDVADILLHYKDEDVVPIRERPRYSNRRRFSSVLHAVSPIMRSHSDPRLHASAMELRRHHQQAASMQQQQQQHHHPQKQRQRQRQHQLTSLQDFYDTAESAYASSYVSCASSREGGSESPCSRSLSSLGSGPRIGLMGMLDPELYTDAHSANGWDHDLPLSLVVLHDAHDVRKAQSMGDLLDVSNATAPSTDSGLVTMHRQTLASFSTSASDSGGCREENAPRMAVLQRNAEGYGFVLRGAKSYNAEEILHFKPTAQYPALQYLDSVDPGGQSYRAGLRAGTLFWRSTART